MPKSAKQKPNEAQPVSKRVVRVFISSPGDISEERKIAKQVLEGLNSDSFVKRFIDVEIVAWDRGAGVAMPANITPQEAINRGLPLPSECDIVVVIMWCRMGTPMPPEYQKPDGTDYLSGTEWEYLNACDAADKSGFLPQILVYRCTETYPINPLDSNVQELYIQVNRVQQFFNTFRNPNGSIRCGYHNYLKLTDFRQQLDSHLREVIDFILKVEGSYKENLKPEVTWEGSPFPGLRAFQREDAPIFFGRERETDELIEKLEQNRCIAVVGASGSGKSSLVWAGIVPRIEDYFEVVRFTPGEFEDGNPFTALAAAYKFTLGKQHRISDLVQRLSSNPCELDNLCFQDLASDKKEVLLFIDQFEELFTLVKLPDLQDRFVNLLVKVQEARNFCIILTMRAEFYSRCLDWELSRLLKDGTYPLALPDSLSLKQMITKPARVAGLKFEGTLPEIILKNTSERPGALPLMAYTLEELHKKAEERQDFHLTLADYKAIGGVEGAIGKRAEDIFEELSKSAQDCLAKVFLKLVTINQRSKFITADEQGVATRRRALINQVSKTPGEIELVSKLTDARLLVKDKDSVEVAHEALFVSWHRLKDWLQQTSDDLFVVQQMEKAVEIWKAEGRKETFLWSGERLKDARQSIIEHLHQELTPDQEEFLRPEVERLEAKLFNDTLMHSDREIIGQQLNLIEDNRLGVKLRHTDKLPEIFWCEVPDGVVQLEDCGEFKVENFYIAKYIVTCKQYQAFIDDIPTGYQHNQWWKNLPRQEFRETQQPYRYDNYPRTNVNWLEAMAFCRWLSEKLPQEAFPKTEGNGWVVRLPTEWEWQQAASGGDNHRNYPWGNWCNGEIPCNDAQSGLDRPIAVGMYPQGISPIVGALDMIGNVSEWCLNNYENPRKIDLGSDARRAIRGGSCFEEARSTDLTYRSYANPFETQKYLGFRVVYAQSPVINLY